MKSICHSADQNCFHLYIYSCKENPKIDFLRCYSAYSKSPVSSAERGEKVRWGSLIFKKSAEGSTRPCANASVTVKFTVSWYISHDDKHVYSNDFTRVNTIVHVSFYINRCVFARGGCSRVSVKTPSKTQKNTTPTPSLTVSWLILSSLTMCQITLTNTFASMLSRLSKQMLSCQLTRRRMHRRKQFCYSEWLVFWNGYNDNTPLTCVKSRL